MIHYTREQLLHLRDSPLVTKPENLPAIEQWLEYVYVDRESREKLRIPHSEAQQQQAQNATQNKQQRRTPGEASPMGNFGAGARPSLLATRSHGGSRTGGEFVDGEPGFDTWLTRVRADDVSLGPPKTVFASSRNVHKFGEGGEKGVDGEELEGPRSRFFGDKSNRKSLNEKEGGHNRESWTRRGFGGDEEKPESRWGRREKDADGEKRNGYGDRHERGGWGERRHNGERQGGWRDRERERREPEWSSKPEKEPEWMDDPAPPNAEDDLRTMGMPRNQEQFQKWKEAMSGKKTQVEAPAPEPEPAPAPATKEKSAPAALKLEGINDRPFGGWGEAKPAVSTPEAAPAPAKTGTVKGKGSRFASMFKESQPKEEPPPPPPETGVQKAANNIANGAAEDEAGFKRILQMLGNTNVSQPAGMPDGPASPQPKPNANGSMKQKSRFTGFFDQGAGAKSPERIQSPPEHTAPRHLEEIFSQSRGMPQEGGGMFGGAPQEQRASDHGRPQHHGLTSPEPPPGLNGGNQRPQSGRMNDIFLDQQPPSRGAATPDVNIQNLLAAQRAQRPQGQDKNSEFLLNLLQTKGSSRPPSQQARPDNFPLWLDQPPNQMPEPHAPKPRVPPPPGLFEDQLLRNAPPEAQQQQQMHGNEMPQRRRSQRTAPGMPPGFYDEQSMFMQQQQQQAQQQRRNFADQPPQPQPGPGRRMSGHPSLPQMSIPPPPGMAGPQQQFGGGGGAGGPPPPPPEFLQSATGAGPPPGFNPHMARHPPGLGSVPNMFQQQGGGGGGRGEPPPGFGGAGMQSPPGMAPPGFFGGGGGPGVPPGFGMGGQGVQGQGMAVGGGRGRGFDAGFEGMGGGRR